MVIPFIRYYSKSRDHLDLMSKFAVGYIRFEGSGPLRNVSSVVLERREFLSC